MAAAEVKTPTDLMKFEIKNVKGLKEGESKGSGSYGAVYAVTVGGVPRIAKRLHSILVSADVSQSERRSIQEKFLNECLLLSKLDHPNVVKFIGVHFNPRDCFDVTLIMERLHMDLDKFLKPEVNPNIIPLLTKLSILLDVSSGLLYLHTQLKKPLIHRDLTAGNVLLTENFKVAKIADLGVSRLIDNYAQRTATRTVCPGTQAYMPPEALLERPKYDTPLDIFSFGQLALYVAIQQFPVVYEITGEQMMRAYELKKVALSKRKKWIDKLPQDNCLRDLITSCLKDEPEKRPSTKKLNDNLKALCAIMELEIKDVEGLTDGENKGCGSYGSVYAVTVGGVPRIAKRLHSILVSADISHAERQGIRERFRSECLLLSKLNHRNVVKFIGVHFNPRDRSDVSLIMERLYMDLDKFLKPEINPNIIPLLIKLSILRDVSSGLLYLHTDLETPLIHRDLTASNILLTEDFRQAKIADLGVSKLIQNYAQRAATRTVCPGTQAYMPPEALLEKPKYDTPLDIFSFGHLALYVAIQLFPIVYEISYEEMRIAYETREVAISKRKKWIDKLSDHCLQSLILTCLNDEPEKRPSTRELNDTMKALYSAENSTMTELNSDQSGLTKEGTCLAVLVASTLGVSLSVVSQCQESQGEHPSVPMMVSHHKELQGSQANQTYSSTESFDFKRARPVGLHFNSNMNSSRGEALTKLESFTTPSTLLTSPPVMTAAATDLSSQNLHDNDK